MSQQPEAPPLRTAVVRAGAGTPEVPITVVRSPAAVTRRIGPAPATPLAPAVALSRGPPPILLPAGIPTALRLTSSVTMLGLAAVPTDPGLSGVPTTTGLLSTPATSALSTGEPAAVAICARAPTAPARGTRTVLGHGGRPATARERVALITGRPPSPAGRGAPVTVWPSRRPLTTGGRSAYRPLPAAARRGR